MATIPQPAPPARATAVRNDLILVALVFAMLAIRLFVLANRYAVNIFFWDEWLFNDATLFQDHSLWEIFRWQHGPHRLGVGGVLAAVIEPWFQWNSRTEAFVAVTLVVIAAFLGVYLKYRIFGSLTWTDTLIPIVMLSAARWDMIWNTVDLAIVIFPVLLVLYCLLWIWKNERWKYGLIVALNFVCLHSGFGVLIGLLTPVLLAATFWADRKKNAAYVLSSLAASLLSLAFFFAGYKLQSDSGCASITSEAPSQYFWFVDLMYATAFGATGLGLISRAIGGVVLLLVMAVALLSWKRVLTSAGSDSSRCVVLATMSSFVLIFTVATALGRTCLGLETAHSSRYTLYMQFSVLSLYFFALALPRREWKLQPPVLLLILLLPSLVMPRFDDSAIPWFHNIKANWRACYLSGRTAPECDRICGQICKSPTEAHMQDKLDLLKATQQNLFADQTDVH